MYLKNLIENVLEYFFYLCYESKTENSDWVAW